ncbi:MAG: hypothetical protein B7Z55_09755 [Planctomycetales bacterium 12-60-4]|nr:MAG: hypothetical protein B7Z55_09755 [Planctomycetales bacterium 12-60-4]
MTLVELAASLLGASALVAGLGSALFIALRASDTSLTPAHAILEGSSLLSELQSDLQFATSVTEHTATTLTVVVPDRNGDSTPETIRYRWSGTAGGPLTRQYNGGTQVTIASSVQECQFTYDVRTRTRAGTPVVVTGSETLLDSYGGFFFYDEIQVRNDNWGGQYFSPNLPSNTSSWKVTRVRVKARKADSPYTDVTNVQLRPAGTDNVPTNDVVASTALNESALSTSYSWCDISLTGAAGLLPEQRLCLALTTASTDGSCRLQYSAFHGNLLRWSGSGWTRDPFAALTYNVYGQVTTTTPTTINVNLITGVNIRLRLGSQAASAVETGVELLNLPSESGT